MHVGNGEYTNCILFTSLIFLYKTKIRKDSNKPLTVVFSLHRKMGKNLIMIPCAKDPYEKSLLPISGNHPRKEAEKDLQLKD